jgi:hypothetical protein
VVDTDVFPTVVTEGPGFVRITVSGPSTGARLRRLLERVVAEIESRGMARVLIDGREVPPPIPTTDKYDIGVAVARALDARTKLAVLGRPVNIDHFFETVARNRGANVGVFTEEKAALEWLVGSAAAASGR